MQGTMNPSPKTTRRTRDQTDDGMPGESTDEPESVAEPVNTDEVKEKKDGA